MEHKKDSCGNDLQLDSLFQSFLVYVVMLTYSVFPLLLMITLIYLLFTPFSWLSFLYLAFYMLDWNTPMTGGRGLGIVNSVKSLGIWNHFRDYFPVTLVKTCDLDPKMKYIICSHPHGLICFGALVAFCSDAVGFSAKFPGIYPRLTTLGANFVRPYFREAFLCFGGVSSSKRSLECILEKAECEAPVLVVGGLNELEQRCEKQIKLHIKNRKGFIKLALRNGASLVPSFSFGESSLFRQNVKICDNLFQRLKELVGFSPIIFNGRGNFQKSFGALPQRNPINVVVGEPIAVERCLEPSIQQIEELHERYTESLQSLYSKYNPIYGDQSIELVIN